MWSRLFKSKSSSKENRSRKNKLSNVIKNLSFPGSSASSSAKGQNGDINNASTIETSEVLSDTEEIADANADNLELKPCPICSRTFLPPALEKHVGICEKMAIQKRTPFDSFRQRREGTDLANYLPSNYVLPQKQKSPMSVHHELKTASKTIPTVHNASAIIANRHRITPKIDCPKSTKKDLSSQFSTTSSVRSSKRSLGPINEICPHCRRSFGVKAYDRHVEWCREKTKFTNPSMTAQQHLAKERMQARTKYKAPSVRSKREKNREKYSSLSESINNLSDSGGGGFIGYTDFNSVADPYERERKCSIMSLSMTSSVNSEGGLSDKYDPFMSAKRQLEDLFSPTAAFASSTPYKDSTSSALMSTSLTAKSPSSQTKNLNSLKSSFRRTSSLRVPKKPPASYMPKYKPTIQRGISDEGPISSNFLKPEEYDELPVKSHAVIPPDLVPKSPKSPSRDLLATSAVVKRQQNSSANRRNLCSDIRNMHDFQLSKTDSLAAFLKFENELECSPKDDARLSEKELKDKSNSLNKRSFSRGSFAELLDSKIDNGERWDAAESQNNNKMPIENHSQTNQTQLDPTMGYSELIDDTIDSIDSKLINSCDNLRISNISKLPNESSSFDLLNESINEAHDRSEGSIENLLVTNNNNLSSSKRDTSNADSNNSHQNIELINNPKNVCETDKRSPKRQLQLRKDNLLFDNTNALLAIRNDINSMENSDDDFGKEFKDSFILRDTAETVKRQQHSSPKTDDQTEKSNKLIPHDSHDIESLFDDFDIEEFISSFSDNEQFPIFKNYKEMGSSSRPIHGYSTANPHSSDGSSDESEFGDKFDVNDINENKVEIATVHTPFNRGNSIIYANYKQPDVVGIDEQEGIDAEVEDQLSENEDEKKDLDGPDVTAEAKLQMRHESLNSEPSIHVNHQNQNISKNNEMTETVKVTLDESGMSQAERELLASVQELNRMCDSTKAFQLDSANKMATVENFPFHIDSAYGSLFCQSPIEKPSSSLIRSNQRNRTQHITGYQIPELGVIKKPHILTTNNAINIQRETADSNKIINNQINRPSASASETSLPPISIHKNDSQNIYNTINMTPLAYENPNTNRAGISTAFAHRKPPSLLPTKELQNNSAKISKFCHECGAKFIVDQAKFCMECGVRRVFLK